MNLQVQEVGYYLQWSLLQLNFFTDAFGQLREGEGRATDGQASEAWWMDSWMVFYQAWWVAWASFVGLFIARISRGRTVGEVIMFSLIIPVLYCILWFSVWGGVAIRQSRQGMELAALGMNVYNDSGYFLVPGSDFCYDVPQDSLTHPDDSAKVVFENHLPGVTPVCQFDPDNAENSAYNVLYSFSFPKHFDKGFGPGMSVLFIIALAIYFATSSDSGSLIVDHLASNGRLRHHWIQRLFWAVTEGAVATALLTAGGSSALAALQAGSVIAGLPFVFMLCWLMQSIWVFCEYADRNPTGEYKLPSQPEFTFPIFGGLFNIMEYLVSFGQVNKHRVARHMHLPTSQQVEEGIRATITPFYSLFMVLNATYPRNTFKNTVCVAFYFLSFIGWIGCFAASGKNEGLVGWGWAFYFMAAITLGAIRYGFRCRFNIRSNILGDFLGSLFFWPQVLAQLRIQCLELGLPNDKVDEVEEYETEKNVAVATAMPEMEGPTDPVKEASC
jgi:hypothetical protein